MTFASSPMVFHETKGDSFRSFPVGHFYWAVDAEKQVRHLWMKLPRQDGDPAGSACVIMVNGPDGKHSWGWDGNLEAPTLTPSVFYNPNHPESPEHWHGFIRNGVMEGC